jgi:hypothetical protein
LKDRAGGQQDQRNPEVAGIVLDAEHAHHYGDHQRAPDSEAAFTMAARIGSLPGDRGDSCDQQACYRG